MRIEHNARTIAVIPFLLLLAIYYLAYSRSIMPPQTGWVQDIASRMASGEVMYRDFFWYTPPYFPWLTELLYGIFNNHMLAYSVIGFFLTKVPLALVLYYFASTVTTPVRACLCVIAGIALSSTYNVEQLYDTNPLLLSITAVQGFLMWNAVKTDNNKSAIVLLILCGALSGIQIMTKQTSASVLIACIIVVPCAKRFSDVSYKTGPALIALILGSLVGILPGILRLLYEGSFSHFVRCVSYATTAKGGVGVAFSNVLSGMVSIPEILIATGICLHVGVFPELHLRPIQVFGKDICASKIVRRLVYTIAFSMLVLRFSGVLNAYGKELSAGSVVKHVLALALFLGGCLLVAIAVRKLRVSSILCAWATLVLLAIGLLVWRSVGIAKIERVLWFLSFPSSRKYLLLLVFYVFLIMWAAELINILQRKNEVTPIFVFSSIYFGFFAATLLSAVIEELYIAPMLAMVCSRLIPREAGSDYPSRPTAILVPALCALCLVCLGQKIAMPYGWHAWTVTSIADENNPVTPVAIEGLEGVLLPKLQAQQYERVVRTIEEFAAPEDEIYEFPTVPLFNVLTQHSSKRYLAAPWFDVAPDGLAKKTGSSLWRKKPRFVLWGEIGNDWTTLETVYRGGKKSGQREIKRFYDEEVQKHYQRLCFVLSSQSTGYSISLWKRVLGSTPPSDGTVIPFENSEISHTYNLKSGTRVREVGFQIRRADRAVPTTFEVKVQGTNGFIATREIVVNKAQDSDYLKVDFTDLKIPADGGSYTVSVTNKGSATGWGIYASKEKGERIPCLYID